MSRWVPRPKDLAVAAALATAVQVELWLLAPPGFPTGAVAAGYAVGGVAVAWHRVAPMVALVVGIAGLAVVPGALGVDPAAALFGWFVTALGLMASAGFHARRPGIVLVVALALWAASVVLEKGFAPADIAFAWLLAAGAWLGGRAVAGRTARAELSEQRAAAAEQEAHWRAAAAVAEERLRIAREMHDVVSHGLSVVMLHVGGVRRLLRPDQLAEREALETAERTGREALAEMHRMLGVLRAPDGAAPAPGLDRLPELLEQARAAGVKVELAVTGAVRPVAPGVDLAAYRIVQEAVTNVLRHARAGCLRVAVTYGPEVLRLSVVDDGTGTGGPTGLGQGLVGMRERAAAHGGSVRAGPAGERGWAVHAVLPVPASVPVTSDGEPA